MGRAVVVGRITTAGFNMATAAAARTLSKVKARSRNLFSTRAAPA